MERTLLKQAREDRNLKQREVAEAIECSIDALGMWERGAEPSDYYRAKLCKFYGKSRAELGLGEDLPLSEGEKTMLKNKLESLGRRQLLELLSQLSFFAGVDLSALSESSIVKAPDEILRSVRLRHQRLLAFDETWRHGLCWLHFGHVLSCAR